MSRTAFLLSLVSLSLLSFTSPMTKAAHAGFADDTDLSAGIPSTTSGDEIPLDLAADEIQTTKGELGLTIEVVREQNGKMTPVAGVRFTVGEKTIQMGETDDDGVVRFRGCKSGPRGVVTASAVLKNDHFDVAQSGAPYRLTVQAECGTKVKLSFKSDSNGGQVLGIWQIAQKAKQKLESAVGLRFWQNPISFEWPGQGDYYQWGTIHITRGDHWDVVGHELGHAIYDQAHIGLFGGGPHKIDECYSTELALSEGWASYFSAWVSVSLADPDAKFEYMVPRRAPIRFENVPADVCRGQTNEWRVTAFLWDLIDFHVDSEASQETFARVWKALLGGKARSAQDTANSLKKTGFQPEVVELLWNLNF